MLKSVKKVKDEPVHLRVTELEKAQIQAKANKYTGGNISEWLRYAGMHCTPPASELIPNKRRAVE